MQKRQAQNAYINHAVHERQAQAYEHQAQVYERQPQVQVQVMLNYVKLLLWNQIVSKVLSYKDVKSEVL